MSEDERAAVNGKAAAAALNSSRMDIGKPASPVLPPPRPAPEPAPAQMERKAEVAPVIEEPAREETAASSPSASAEEDSEEEKRPVQKNPGRCFSCNKRVGLTGFKCRCDYVFCAAHRYVNRGDPLQALFETVKGTLGFLPRSDVLRNPT